MSFSDDYEFDELDSATLQALDTIESTAVENSAPSVITSNSTTPNPPADKAARLGAIEREIAKLKYPHSDNSGSNPRKPVGHTARGFRPVTPSSITRVSTLDESINLMDEDDIPMEPEFNTPSPQRSLKSAGATSSNKAVNPHSRDTDSFMTESDESFVFDEAALQQIDRAAAAALSGRPIVTTNKLTRQTTLTGEIFPTHPSRSSFARTKSSSGPQNSAAPKVKTWSHATALSRTASGRALSSPKGKGREEDPAGETGSPPLPVPGQPPPPMILKCDLAAAEEWIYPLNHPKRDYQYNIVRRALFDNTLVALPTGLGKTFVAGVVMLNYYRWFPKGKIVFLAPTKPLVAQQIEASHQTCGIPGDDAAELTGHVKDDRRALLWDAKRVFYLTPQTFVNDLRKIPNLASQVVLIVVDEAHRATGGYAYSIAIRDMMVFNPHFRVLALTATPGSNRDAVQAVVDNMHISHIEIRDEQALDLRQYVHRKKLIQHMVELPQDIAEIADTIVKLMERLCVPVGQFIPGAVMRSMNEYRALKAISELQQRDRWAIGILSNLASLARARTYLITQSLEMCYEALLDIESGTKSDNGKRKYPQKKLAEEPLFKTIMRLFKQRQQASSSGSMVHPKMDRLRSLLLQYFADRPPVAADLDPSHQNAPAESKVMVFTSYRRAVEQIVDQLNLDAPIIRTHRFIGQAATKDGVKGLSQKEQLRVIEEFKKGTFNTLICTSIGEEGLDIGEVDYIVCYDSHKAPIKMLQRIGRTGRKKDGDIAVLVAEGKEETNFEKAKEAYNMVQNSITKGDHIELYTDVPRLLPSSVRPQPHEMVMPIVGYQREASRRSSKSVGTLDKYVTKTRPSKEPKLTAKERKKMLALANALANAESDDSESVDLDLTTTKGKDKKTTKDKPPSKPRKPKKPSEAAALSSHEKPSTDTRKKKRKKMESSSSSDDEKPPPKASKKPAKGKEIEPGRGSSRRKGHAPSKTSGKRAREDHSESLGESPPRRKKKRGASVESPHSSSSDVPGPSRAMFPTSPTMGFISGTGRKLVPNAVTFLTGPIEISSDDDNLASRNAHDEPLSPFDDEGELNMGEGNMTSYSRTKPTPPPPARVDSTRIQVFTPSASLSPAPYLDAPRSSLHGSARSPGFPINLSPDYNKPSTSNTAPRFAGVHDWLLDSDSDDAPVISRSSGTFKQPHGQALRGRHHAQLSSHSSAPAAKQFWSRGASGRESFTENSIANVEAPSLSTKPASDLSDTSIELLPISGQILGSNAGQFHEPETGSFVMRTKAPSEPRMQSSSPIQPPGRKKRRKRSTKTALTLLSQAEDAEHHSGSDTSGVSNDKPIVEHKYTTKGRKPRRRPVYDRNNEYVAMEADLSGEDVVGGSTDTESEEDEYDRKFIADGDVTQRSDYDQSAIYLQGLQTQAPSGLNFANRPVRVGVFGQAFSRTSRRAAYLSSSPRRPDSEDAYEFGSFVVEDEDVEGEG